MDSPAFMEKNKQKIERVSTIRNLVRKSSILAVLFLLVFSTQVAFAAEKTVNWNFYPLFSKSSFISDSFGVDRPTSVVFGWREKSGANVSVCIRNLATDDIVKCMAATAYGGGTGASLPVGWYYLEVSAPNAWITSSGTAFVEIK